MLGHCLHSFLTRASCGNRVKDGGGEQPHTHRERQPSPARRGSEPGGTVYVLLPALDDLPAHHERGCRAYCFPCCVRRRTRQPPGRSLPLPQSAAPM